MQRIAQLILCTCALFCAGQVMAEEAAKKYVEPKLVHAPYGDVKIVVPMTSSDFTVWMHKIGNINNALTAAAAFNGHLKIKVVAYGAGIQLLAQKGNSFADAVNDMRAKGVQFEVCNQSLKGWDMDFHTMNGVTDSDVVPAGFLEVAWLQTQGYVVDPLN